jgi:hypothetical protein
MQNPLLIETGEALKLVEKLFRPITLPTLIEWSRKYKLGLKIGGRWFIDKNLLTKFLTKGSQKWKKGGGAGRPKKNQSTSNSRNQQTKN